MESGGKAIPARPILRTQEGIMFGKEQAAVQKRTLVDFRRMKAKGEPITWITAYDFTDRN